MGLMRVRLRLLMGQLSGARAAEGVFLLQEGSSENQAQMEGALMSECALQRLMYSMHIHLRLLIDQVWQRKTNCRERFVFFFFRVPRRHNRIEIEKSHLYHVLSTPDAV